MLIILNYNISFAMFLCFLLPVMTTRYIPSSLDTTSSLNALCKISGKTILVGVATHFSLISI